MKQNRFGDIMNRYKNFIFSYAYYFSGSRENAEDLTQEVLLRIWQNMDSLRVGPTKSWIAKVTRNLCIDWARRKNPASDASIPLEEVENQPKSHPRSVEQTIEREEVRSALKAAIARLPENLRTPIILREIEDMKYEEIGEALDMPLNSVKVNIHRGRRLLRERLRNLCAPGSPREVIPR
jgi:RNA polymerase sigma-70 factor (ECF subfamily)